MVLMKRRTCSMYIQREAINVQTLYDLAVKREDVWADKLYNACWAIYRESKIEDLSKVKVIYTDEHYKTHFCNYNEIPEIMKQLAALAICLIGRWFNDLHSGKESILERFKLSCRPTDFWHDTGIFSNDNIKCRNMDELIEKIHKKKD